MRRALAVLALLLALPLAADDAAAREKLIVRLLDAIDVGRLTEIALRPLPEADEKTRAVLEGLSATMGRAELVELYTPLFDEGFTNAELEALVKFYETPLGQKSAHLLAGLGSNEILQWVVLSSPRAEELAAEYERRHTEPADPTEVTIGRLLSIATATEAYATDTNEYPRVHSVDELRPLLEPIYIKTMPAEDAWGTKLFYISDGRSYRFVSAGSDGRFEWSVQVLETGELQKRESDAPGLDLVFQDGQFIQRPPQRPEPPPGP